MPKIMIDAGHHGKYNKGSVAGYYESDMAWTLHNYLKTELKSYGFEVNTTRTDKNKTLDVYDRGRKAKGYDLLISLHSNASSSKSTKRVVVYHPISGAGRDIAQKLADAILDTMNLSKDKYWYATTATRAYRSSKPTTDYYGVIRGAVAVDSVGLIVEHSFHTNEEACRWLMSDTNLKKLAVEEAKVIADFYNMKKKTSSATLYRVQTGAYKKKANAVAMYNKVKTAGFSACIKLDKSLYRVQVGAYKNKANAEKTATKLKKAGFNAIITTNGGTTVSVG